MRSPRKASSQVSWSLLTEGVTQARVEAHRLRLMLDRAMSLVQTSVAREHLYQVGGDLIQGFPERLSELERSLDRTSYALVVMGEDFLRGRIPVDDRYVVDEATKTALVAGAAVVLQPSYMESFSLALVEGWLLERPALVQGRSRVLAGHIGRSHGGLTYEDYPSFEAAMAVLSDRPDLARRMAVNGLAYSLVEFRWDKVRDTFLSVVEEARLAGGRRLAGAVRVST